MAGEQFSDEYKVVNPNSTIPALVLDDGTVMSEVVGMCLYLDNLYPQKPLMGAPGLAQAMIVSYMHRISHTGFAGVAEALRNSSERFINRAQPGALDLEQIPELVPRGKKKLAFFYDQVEAELQDRDFLVGDELTQADIDLRVVCDFAAIIKQKVSETCPALAAHQQRVTELIPLQK